MVENTGHHHQTDAAVIIPVEICLIAKTVPQLDIVRRYELFSHLWLQFLDQSTKLPTELGKHALYNIQHFKAETKIY